MTRRDEATSYKPNALDIDFDALVAIDQQIDAYKKNGTPFHTYYMSVSGHCNYGWSVNDMSRKNKNVMNGKKGPETVLAYKASRRSSNTRIHVGYLLGQLDEADIAEDAMIALTADHYPYAMSENSDMDYYAETTKMPISHP